MFERDYLMKLLMEFATAVRRSMEHEENEHVPEESARMLDDAVGRAVDFDGDMLLSLSPQSLASMLQVVGTDPRVTGYAAHSLLLSACYYADAGEGSLADLRREQARAVAEAYGFDLSDCGDERDAMRRFLECDQGSI